MTDGKPEFLQPDGVHAPTGGSSHAVVAGGAVYVAGQVGVDPSGSLADGFEAQATQALENLFPTPGLLFEIEAIAIPASR
jgi:2-iminobutanoate/2-iminopropanoate deaminase